MDAPATSATSDGIDKPVAWSDACPELLRLPLADVRALLAAGEVSATDLMTATLEEVARVDVDVHAFLAIDSDWALDLAGRLDAERTGPTTTRSPLWGLPVPVKDVEPTIHLPTTYGSALRRGHPSQSDGVVARRLRDAGAIVFGKTNTPAFAHKDTTDNLLGLPTANPHNLARTAGGSSGGAAAAVAAHMVHIAHGTDGAGSGRLPAAFCGVVGFKPSYGLIPKFPTTDHWSARSHQAMLGRTVDDVRMAVSALAGPDHRDPLSLDGWAMSPILAARERLRVGFAATLGFGVVDDDILEVCRTAAMALASSSIAVQEVRPHLSDPADWFGDLWRPAMAHDLASEAQEHPDLVEESLRTVIELGMQTTAQQMVEAQARRTQLYGEALQSMGALDVLLTPTMPTGAWAVDGSPPTNIGEAGSRPAGGRWGHLILSNLTGWPAASVPVGRSREGMPVGLQVMARWHEDAICLEVAEMIERAVGGAKA
jgi:Asp-tRNA(Asn)/Glu-tRNA(Gln) amidotransferase A subunit family amidase